MATLDQYALVTLDNVREALGFTVTESGDDSLLTNLINRVSTRIETYCRRKFKVRSYTEYHDGDGSPEVLVDNYPIVSVDSLWDDTDRAFTDSANDLIASGDYIKYETEGAIRLFNNETVFQTGWQNIKVTYSGGYTTIPADIEQASIDWVVTLYRKQKDQTHGYMTKAASGTSIMIDLQAIPKDVKDVLDSHKKFRANRERR